MQMKLEEEKLVGQGNQKKLRRDQSNGGSTSMLLDAQMQHQNPQSSFSSTQKSFDLPPKEVESQLQQYEFEVRNHIKVE